MNYFSTSQERDIRHLIRDCGQQAKRMAAEEFQVFQKGLNDYVTSVDLYLDQRLTEAFAALFPEDGVISEENTASRAAFQASYSRLWMIDPVDGTEAFIQRKAEYAVMVGLLQRGQPIAGWVYAPVPDQMYYGGKDWGLFQSIGGGEVERLIPVEPAAPSEEFCPILIGHRDQNNFGGVIAQAIPEAQFYSLGSFGLKVMDVILGKAGLYLYLNGRVKLWDTTGPLALARAAGLVCCDLAGQPIQFNQEAIELETLTHQQSIVIGWSRYVEALRPKIAAAVTQLQH